MGIFERMAYAIARAQDQESGLWYQVMDQNGREGNYLEASASCMLTYALAKGQRLHYLAELDRKVVDQAYAGILRHLVTEDEQGYTCTAFVMGLDLEARNIVTVLMLTI